MAKIVLNFMQKTRAMEVLKEHCSGDGTHATYADGFDDAKVSALVTERFGFVCAPTIILGLRRAVFGNLGRNNPPAELSARVKALEALVAELMAWKLTLESDAK